jgi:hypothetical protein
MVGNNQAWTGNWPYIFQSFYSDEMLRGVIKKVDNHSGQTIGKIASGPVKFRSPPIEKLTDFLTYRSNFSF